MPLWIAGALACALLAASCIQPESESDFFGAEGSTVTGEDDDGDGDDAAEKGEGDRPDARASRGERDAAASNADGNEPGDRTGKGDDDESPSQPVDRADGGGPGARDADRPTFPDAAQPPPSADSGAVGLPDTGVSGEPGGPAATKLTVSVTTVTARGRYSPRHVLAVWVADGQGKFVKTLAKHAGIRGRWLTGWNAAAAGNVVDAVTSATLSSHGTRTLTWNLTNAQKMPVPEGEYKIMMEFTEANGTGVSHAVSFAKGPAGLRMMPPSTANFTNLSIALE